MEGRKGREEFQEKEGGREGVGKNRRDEGQCFKRGRKEGKERKDQKRGKGKEEEGPGGERKVEGEMVRRKHKKRRQDG